MTAARELAQCKEQQDRRCGVKQNVSQMMSPGLESVELAIQHVPDGGEWLPVASAEMSEGPLHIIKSKTAGYSWIGIDVRTIVVIHELVVQRFAVCFLIQHSYRAIVGGPGFLVRVTHCGQPHSSEFAQGTHHMKDDACLARLAEVQVVPHHDVKKIVGRQGAILGRLDVVAGDKKLLPAIRSCEDRRLRIVGAVGEKLQGQKRMSCAAFSQVNLDGIRLPFSVGAYNHKIQSETPYHSFLRQTPADLGSFPGNQRSVTRIGREHAAEVALP